MAARPRANGAAVPASDKPWHAYLTLDLLAHVLSNSIFHPFIAWLIPLCLRSLAYPAHHPYIRNTWIYATAVTIVAILRYLDSILAWGPRREINWDEEVVVITGGSGGLGRVMAEMFSMKGVSVALLDVRPPEGESEALLNAKHYYCDVGNPDAIAEAKACIEKDVRSNANTTSPFILSTAAHTKSSPHSSAHPQSSSTTPASSTAPPSSPSPPLNSIKTSPSTSSHTSKPSAPSSPPCCNAHTAAT